MWRMYLYIYFSFFPGSNAIYIRRGRALDMRLLGFRSAQGIPSWELRANPNVNLVLFARAKTNSTVTPNGPRFNFMFNKE
jgi:hypothetical protein